MSSDAESRDPVEVLAESFLERWRAGERPTPQEYAERHPELAERILTLFPALVSLEDFGADETHTPRKAFDDDTPERLGEYRLLREIGRGGMGIVFEAEQESLGRHVAVKVLPGRAFPDDRHLERFRQEARAAARLHHTNIVPVFGVGADGGVHYYAMQYIHGQSLAEVLAEVRRLRLGERRDLAPHDGTSAASVARSLVGGFTTAASAPPPAADDAPPRRDRGSTATSPNARASLAAAGSSASVTSLSSSAVVGLPREGSGKASLISYYRSVAHIGLQVAEALAYAHGEGIVHRDIKPANLLLDTRGTVWVTDFGLAKADESGDLTGSGNVVGTLRYMAPERFDGIADALGDVYGLGVTLYELLALRPVFDAVDRARLIQEIGSREPPPPRRIDPGVPRDLETVVLKAMAKDARDRYTDAGELASDLRRFLAREPIEARRITAPERFVRWCQRNPTVAALSAAIALLVVTLAISATVSAVKIRAQRDATLARLVEAKLAEGRAWRASGVAGQRLKALRALEDATRGSSLPAFDLRTEVLASRSLTDLEVIDETPVPDVYAVVSPRLERWAIAGADGAIEVFDYGASQAPATVLPAIGTWIYHAQFSPGARYLLTRGVQGPISVWDLDVERIVLEVPPPPQAIPATFLPDESAIVSVEGNGDLVVRSLPEGRELTRREAGLRLAQRLVVAPDGRRVATVQSPPADHVVRLYDLESGTELGRLHHSERTPRVAWHPDGDLLAVACHDFKVHVWDTRSLRRVRVLTGHLAEVHHVAYSHDGRLLASTSWANRTRLWDARSGAPLVSAFGVMTAFSSDSETLGFQIGSYTLGTWRVAAAREYRVLRVDALAADEKYPQTTVVSPDGRWVAAIAGPLGVRVWSLPRQDQSVLLEGFAVGAAFEPDGAALLVSNDNGLVRWPIHDAEDDDGRVTFGPPRRLDVEGDRISAGGPRSTLAIVQGRTVGVYETRPTLRELDRFEHPGVHRVDVSASGRWIASSAWRGTRVLVREPARRETIAELPATASVARFSPDERWIAIGGGPRVTLYSTEDWKLRHSFERERAGTLPAAVAFSGDSALLAFARTSRDVEIRSTESGEAVARLEPPELEDLDWLDFGPDGSWLTAASATQQAVKVWDLRMLRAALAELGLDWTPPLPPPQKVAAPSSLRADAGVLTPSTARDAALEDVRRRGLLGVVTREIELDPRPDRLRERAELQAELGAFDEAVADLDRAIDLAPDDDALIEVRASLLRRRGDVGGALADLERVVALRRARRDHELNARRAEELERAERERDAVARELEARRE